MPITILDGPIGTELLARGVATPLPGWSAHAIETAPEVIAAIHRDYSAAGAKIHRANTFRTQKRIFPDKWEELTAKAVQICRDAISSGGGGAVAGSIAPLEDCYRPDLSPAHPAAEHCEMARALAEAGCDMLICETFPSAREGLIALEQAAGTGLPVFISFTAGPKADLLTPRQMRDAARTAAGLGAMAVMVNCTPASKTLAYVRALAEGVAGVPHKVAVGAYANAGSADEKMGWMNPTEKDVAKAARRYADLAEKWVEAGARVVGSCCGTGPGHIAELARRFSHLS